MADKDGNIIAKDYGIGIKPPAQHFHVKGHENAGWGMKARLSQIFAADGQHNHAGVRSRLHHGQYSWSGKTGSGHSAADGSC